MSTRIAFITSSAHPDLWDDDCLVLPFLPAGIELHSLPWDSPDVDWADFDAVVLRGCWDYHERLPEFLDWLTHCEQEGVRLWNPVPLVRWNLDKHYLQELQRKGVEIPDTLWLEPRMAVDLPALLQARQWDRAVIKPAVSLGAWNTWISTPASAVADQQLAAELLEKNIALLVQPFLPEILEEGEWSLLFFNGVFSHALLKRPKGGDFRVQHVHGGSIHPSTAPDWMVDTALEILGHVPYPSLYARVDGIRRADRFLLMEVELIEPVLYLGYGAGAPQRWAAALLEGLRG